MCRVCVCCRCAVCTQEEEIYIYDECERGVVEGFEMETRATEMQFFNDYMCSELVCVCRTQHTHTHTVGMRLFALETLYGRISL